MEARVIQGDLLSTLDQEDLDNALHTLAISTTPREVLITLDILRRGLDIQDNLTLEIQQMAAPGIPSEVLHQMAPLIRSGHMTREIQ